MLYSHLYNTHVSNKLQMQTASHLGLLTTLSIQAVKALIF